MDGKLKWLFTCLRWVQILWALQFLQADSTVLSIWNNESGNFEASKTLCHYKQSRFWETDCDPFSTYKPNYDKNHNQKSFYKRKLLGNTDERANLLTPTIKRVIWWKDRNGNVPHFKRQRQINNIENYRGQFRRKKPNWKRQVRGSEAPIRI